MWRVCREAGRPWPVISDDPVIDYMVMEAVMLKVRTQDQEAQKAQDREAWKKKKQEELAKQFN